MADQGASGTSTITVADGRPKHPGKLRQTCDPCSEAKVKCDKGNPRCGRCDRLSYDCVYSPARRIGRPRPRSWRSPDHDGWGRSARDARDDGASVAANEATNKTYTTPVPATTLASSVHATAPGPAPARPARQHTPTAQHPNLTDDELMPDRHSDEGRWSAPASAGASSGASTRSKDRSNDRSSARSSDAPPRSASTSTRDSFLGGGLEQPLSSAMDGVRHNPYEYDCATVAITTLTRLAAAGLDNSQQQPAGQATAAAADVLADQVPHACRQAARILVCPCSSDADTALLAVSLAAAILDVAGAALRALKPAGHALDDERHTVLALGTIPAISRVVTLFTHRYSAAQAGRPPDAALLLLAASLRTTLKAMAEETTDRFLDSGAAPSPRRRGS